MPGKNSKQTKKFVKSKLKGVLERRKEYKQKQRRFGNKKKSDKGNARSDDRSEDADQVDGEDEEVDFSTQFDRKGKGNVASLNEKEKAFLEESEDEDDEDDEADEDEEQDEEDNDELPGEEKAGSEDEEQDETESPANTSLKDEVCFKELFLCSPWITSCLIGWKAQAWARGVEKKRSWVLRIPC